MVKGDREIGGAGEELEKPCHYIFDMETQDPSKGGYVSLSNLQVENQNEIPYGAKNVRPVFEGSVVQETYDLADPKHPIPVRIIHTHSVPEQDDSFFGFKWTTTRKEKMSFVEAVKFKANHPLPKSY